MQSEQLASMAPRSFVNEMEGVVTSRDFVQLSLIEQAGQEAHQSCQKQNSRSRDKLRKELLRRSFDGEKAGTKAEAEPSQGHTSRAKRGATTRRLS